MGFFFLFYFMTFPWWFLPQTIPYAHGPETPAYFTRKFTSLERLEYSEQAYLCTGFLLNPGDVGAVWVLGHIWQWQTRPTLETPSRKWVSSRHPVPGQPPNPSLSRDYADLLINQFSEDEAITSLAALNYTGELVGCNVEYAWCSSTTRINFIVFIIFAILAIGFAMPLSNINIDILYSKVLGPIKQGLLQGIMASAGQAISIVGPLLIT